MKGDRLALCLLTCLAGCGSDDGPSSPVPHHAALVTSIRITVATSGSVFDTNGYVVTFNPDASAPGSAWRTANVPTNGTIDVTDATPGRWWLRLRDVATNCEPTLPYPVQVTVIPQQTTRASIAVRCGPQGILRVETRSTGANLPSAGYRLTLTDSATQDEFVVDSLAPNDVRTFDHLPHGSYSLGLTVPEHCDIAPSANVPAAVTSATTTSVAFTMTCSTPTPLVLAEVLDGNADIYVVMSDGSGHRRLTDDPADDLHPRWSPDGRHIAFVSTRSGTKEIYVMDADGSHVIRLTDGPSHNLDPSWSPDGTRIAFTSARDGDEEIYVMHADGSGQRRLTNRPGADVTPAWSPDGAHIAFDSERPDGWKIHLLTVDGGSQTRLLDRVGDQFEPAWSPDGKRIAFVGGSCDGTSCPGTALFVANADGSSVIMLENSFLSGSPSWSPDGRKLAYAETCSVFGCPFSDMPAHIRWIDGSRDVTLPTSQVVDVSWGSQTYSVNGER